jgi:hypothetical protein
MTIAEERKFNSEFSLHTGLIHTLTRKCWGRLKEAGLDEFEYDDVYQINCVSYVKAAKAYDATRGITFGAYLGRAIYNEFNKFADRVINEKHELGFVSYNDFSSEENDADFLEYHNADVDLTEVGADTISRETARENIAKLSVLGRLVIRELLSPTDALKRTFEGIKAHSEVAKQTGEKYIRVPKSIDMRTIRLHYGFRQKDIVGLRYEFKQQLGVEIE